MKKILTLLIAILLGISFSANNIYAAKHKPEVRSNKQYFDPTRGLYVLQGDVYVGLGSRTVTADQATFDPTSMDVWAQGHITLLADDITFRGHSLYVYSNRKIAAITGDISFQRPDISITSNYTEFNWKTKIALFTGDVVVTKGDGTVNKYDTLEYNVVENRILS